MGKAKERELVVLLFERWEALRKLGVADPWCDMRPEKWPDAKSVDSSLQFWWTWLVDSAMPLGGNPSSGLAWILPESGSRCWLSRQSESSSVPLVVAMDKSLSKDFFLLSTSFGMEMVVLSWLLSSFFSVVSGTIELVKTAFWTYKTVLKRNQNHIVLLKRCRDLDVGGNEDWVGSLQI